MADREKIYSIKINGIKEATEEVASLGSLLDEVHNKVQKQIETFDKEYAKSIERSKQQLKEMNKEVKNEIELEKAHQTVMENNTSTYKKKQELLTALGKVIRNMTTNTQDEIEKQKALKAQYAQLNQELKNFDAEMGNHQRSVGDYRGALRDMNMELKGIEGEMASLLANGASKTDEQFKALAKRAGEISDAISDAREEVKRFASDTKTLDDVVNLAQSATAVFGLAKGAMSAFGMETENAEKAIQQLAGAMSIIQSLKTLSESLQNGSASARLFNKTMTLLGVNLLKADANTIKAAASNSALTASQKASTIATRSFSMALKAIPLMLVISLIVDLVNHWEEFCGWLKESGVDVEALSGYFDKFMSVVKGVGRAITTYIVGSLKSGIGAFRQLISGDFNGAWDTIMEGFKLFQQSYEAGLQEFRQSEVNNAKKAAAELAEIEAKKTKDALDELKAREGDSAKYSKRGIQLQKQYFNQMREAANGNAEKLKQINLDEMNYERELREKNLSDHKKYLSDMAAADADAAKKAKEQADLMASITDLSYREQLVAIDQAVANAEKTVDEFREGPVDKYKKAMELLRTAMDFRNQTRQLSEASKMLKDFSEVVGNVSDEIMNDYINADDEFANGDQRMAGFWMRFVEGDIEEVKKRIAYHFKDLDETSKLKLLELLMNLRLTLQNEQSEYDKEIEKLFKAESVNVKDIGVKQGQEIIEGVEKGLKSVNTEYTSNFWNRILHPKKFKEVQQQNKVMLTTLSSATKVALDKVNTAWEEYIEWLKNAGASELDIKNATEAMNESLKSVGGTIQSLTSTTASANEGGFSFKRFFFGGSNGEKVEDWLPENFNESLQKMSEMVMDVSAPLFNFLDTMYQYEVEAAQNAYDQIYEAHDTALDQLDETRDRIDDIRDKMKDASASETEALKQQLADEMLLLAQREAEENRLAREEDKKRKELEKAEKKQKKTQMQGQFVQAIANAAMSYTQATAAYPPPIGQILGGIVMALTLAQAAVIAKQISKLGNGGVVKFGDGGLLEGRSHAQGGIPIANTGIEVEGGEMVVNKRDSSRYYDVLQKINNNDPSVRYLQGNRGTVDATLKRKYADGGQLNYQSMNESVESLSIATAFRDAVGEIRPVVSVVDIAKGVNNLTTVRDYSGASPLM